MATQQTSPAPLFADLPTERMPGGWQFAAGRETPAAARQGARRAGLVLLLLTLVGGLLRFYHLDYPAIWLDEAFTFGRVFDSYEHLLHTLKVARFTPLHYEALWLQGHFMPLTPFGLRLMSAVAGTLMIPAIYFLARQFTSRNTALVAALFTCFSAFLFTYSRDAKMYMPFWLFCTLNVLFLVRWLRTGGIITWTLWLLTGVAMAGYHALGLVLLAVELPILLTAQRAHWAKALFFIIGAAIIASGPVVYYLKFNPDSTKVDADSWNATGVDWVNRRSADWGGAVHVADTLATHLFSWNWMQERKEGAIEPWLWNGAIAALGVLLGFAALGALPWRNRWRDRSADGDLREAPWRVYAWLAAWIVLPMYATYCLSIADRVDPLAWLVGQQGWLQLTYFGVPTFVWLVGGWIVIALILSISPWVARGATALLVVGMLLIFTALFLRNGFAVIPAAEQWSALLLHPYAILILTILIPALLWVFSGERIAVRCRRTGTFLAVTAGLFVLCVLISRAIPEPLPGSVWMPRYLGFIWPAIAIGTILLLCRLPVWPLRWLAIIFLLSINIAQIGARLWVQSDPPVDLMARDVATAGSDDEVRTFVQHYATGFGTSGFQSIWGPSGRYYLTMATGNRPSKPAHLFFPHWTPAAIQHMVQPASVSKALADDAGARQVIVWLRHDAQDPHADADTYTRALGNRWTLADRQIFHVRTFWQWAELYQLERLSFNRDRPADEAPSASTASVEH